MTTGVDLGQPQAQAIRSDEDVVRVRQLVRAVAGERIGTLIG